MNATFYYFKNNHYYSQSRGVVSLELLDKSSMTYKRYQIMRDNRGVYPGLGESADGFCIVAIPDDSIGFPPMLIKEY